MIGLYFLIGFLFAISYVAQRSDKYVDILESVGIIIILTIWWPIFVIIKLSSP